ncbi:hypothetical protein BST28_17450 [Mycolicibacter kumamotonensis]|uniref:DNA-binding protein n=1 Tax=Mycolicibacter kumamotonensis TaxID=354243 RepID=A0A1X0DZH8_9MYCO|nr:hypothetical protein [Mycolicibacter kumamotonensis]ORA77588.1 hypothetical protein BST28_17450 [Mycolicibacter kumamotonensis]
MRAILRDAMDDDRIPEYAGTGWVAENFGVSRSRVFAAIHAGKLPATRLKNESQKESFLIRPEDAALLWGYLLDDADKGELATA